MPTKHDEPLTSAELRKERQYRLDERLGMLCPPGEAPTPEQIAIAEQEADEAEESLIAAYGAKRQ